MEEGRGKVKGFKGVIYILLCICEFKMGMISSWLKGWFSIRVGREKKIN